MRIEIRNDSVLIDGYVNAVARDSRPMLSEHGEKLENRANNLEFTTPSVEATIFEDEDGNWEKHKVYDTESEANTALEGFFVQAASGGGE